MLIIVRSALYKQCTNIHVGLSTLHTAYPGTVFLLHMIDDSNQIG